MPQTQPQAGIGLRGQLIQKLKKGGIGKLIGEAVVAGKITPVAGLPPAGPHIQGADGGPARQPAFLGRVPGGLRGR